MTIRVGHLYADYLNIYADRGNIAVLAERARARGHELDVRNISIGDAVPGDIDLFYIGGGQDREQELVAHELASKAAPLLDAAQRGVVFLAVCGGYQLLGRSYTDVAGHELPGIGLLPLETAAGDRRMIGDVLLDCEWAGGRTLAGFENHAGRTLLDEGAEPLGRVVSGFGNDGASGYEGCRSGRVYGTYLHGPLLPRNPWFADRLLADALGLDPSELPPLADDLERQAHDVSAARARARGGRF